MGKTPIESGRGHDGDWRQRLMRRLLWKVPVIISLVSFALWWEWGKQKAEPGAAIAGHWSGEVTYLSGARHNERFLFQPEDGRIFGSAEFLGRESAIEGGRWEGGEFVFSARFEDRSQANVRERRNFYRGSFDGRRIVMRMHDDRGSPPVEWALSKNSSKR